MDDVGLTTVAFLLMATSVPLVSYGAMNGGDAATAAGLVVVCLGAAIPPAIRLLGPEAAAT